MTLKKPVLLNQKAKSHIIPPLPLVEIQNGPPIQHSRH